MHEKKKEMRSPLKAKPLRYPGQSLDEEIGKVTDDEVATWAITAMLALLYAALEWFRWSVNSQFHPILVSVLALLFLLFAVRRVMMARKKLRALRLGRDGERAVGQYLEELREKGCRVFHDIVGDGFNVDHVVVSPHGIFTVETKTFSKPKGKDATVKISGGKVFMNGYETERDMLTQAKAQAKWVNMVLRESTGKNYAVRPVIVFPGWYVEPIPKGESRDVWVLNPKVLPTFIENEPEVLERQDVMLATYHLSRHIRTGS